MPPLSTTAVSASVTVIVLLYNDMPHGLAAIDSVLAQTRQDLAVAIIDNGSTDDTHLRLRAYEGDPRVSIIRCPCNQRSEAATRYALTVTTPYLSFLFADDTYRPERIERALELLEHAPHLDYVFFRNAFRNEHGDPVNEVPLSLFSGDPSSMSRWQHLRYFTTHGNSLHPCAMVVRTDTYRRLGGFPRTLHRIGDMAFFARLLANADGLFSGDPMQDITVWSQGRNESSSNIHLSHQLMFERTVLLEEYLTPAVLDNLTRVFPNQQAPNLALSTRAQQLWYLAHQFIDPDRAFDFRLFGFRLLYQAASLGDPDLELRVITATGKSIGQYIDRNASGIPAVAPVAPAPDPVKDAVKRLPGAVPLYRFLKSLAAMLLPGVASADSSRRSQWK